MKAVWGGSMRDKGELWASIVKAARVPDEGDGEGRRGQKSGRRRSGGLVELPDLDPVLRLRRVG